MKTFNFNGIYTVLWCCSPAGMDMSYNLGIWIKVDKGWLFLDDFRVLAYSISSSESIFDNRNHVFLDHVSGVHQICIELDNFRSRRKASALDSPIRILSCNPPHELNRSPILSSSPSSFSSPFSYLTTHRLRWKTFGHANIWVCIQMHPYFKNWDKHDCNNT